jgi:transglutaminase-like putative cysteine protease
VLRILRNIFDYIMGNFTYVLGTTPKSCDQTLSYGYGDCDDLGLLYVSIARAAGIPAWMELGMIPRSSDGLQDWGGHAWVNALVPLSGGNYTVVTVDLANGYYLWMPPYRLSEYVDNGDPEDLKAFYFLFSSQGSGRASFTQDISVASYSEQGKLRIEA